MIDYREDAKWTVYVHIVPKELSGYDWDKYYVGITSKSTEERWGKNGCNYRGQRFLNVINKYGWDNIQHEIIAENLTKNEACDMEKTLISLLKSNNGHGYNYTNGGDGTSGYKPNDEIRRKMGEARKNHIVKPETIEKIRNKNKGYKMPEERKQKMIKNLPDRRYGNNNMSKEVYQFSIDKIFIRKFNAVAEARDLLNIKSNGISRSALEHHSYKGYFWAYSEDIIETNGEYKIREISKNKKLSGKKKKVYQFDLNNKLVKIYNSKADAYRNSGESESVINDDLKNKRKTSRGRRYKWRYEDDVIFNDDGSISIKEETVQLVKVFQFKLDGSFLQMHLFLEDYCKLHDYNINLIRNVLNNKTKNAYGYIWKYEDDVAESTENVGSFLIKERK